MSSDPPSEIASTPENDALLDRHGYRRGQLFAGKYRLEGLLGEGGMGLVLLATHVDLQRTVAIKIVRSELARNDEIVERLLGEAQTAASIRSEHVTRVLDLGRLDSGTPYIVFEYLQGRDLAVLLDEHGPLPFETAIDFVLQVCDALAEAHAAGVIHRDLKPENLFLTHRPDGTPIIKLIDFGISKNLTARDRRAALTNPAQLVGSPYYMAPEQMRGARVVDGRADIWALGVVLYELCTGQTPFAADSIPAVCHLVIQEEPTPPRTFAPDMPEELENIICCCLEKDPGDRYADVAELAAALGPFGTPEGLAYVDRIQRVATAPSIRARLGSKPELGPASLGPEGLPAGHSWRTPLPLASTRGGAPDSQRRNPRRRSRRFAWLTLAAGTLFGAAGAAAVVLLPSRFRIDEEAADLAAMAAMRSLPEPAAAPTPAPAAPPTLPVAVPAEGPLELDLTSASVAPAPPEPVQAEAAPVRSARRKAKARPATTVQSAPSVSLKAVTEAPSAVAPPPPAVAPAPTPTPASAVSPKPKRNVADPWDRKSFGGRR